MSTKNREPMKLMDRRIRIPELKSSWQKISIEKCKVCCFWSSCSIRKISGLIVILGFTAEAAAIGISSDKIKHKNNNNGR